MILDNGNTAFVLAFRYVSIWNKRAGKVAVGIENRTSAKEEKEGLAEEVKKR